MHGFSSIRDAGLCNELTLDASGYVQDVRYRIHRQEMSKNTKTPAHARRYIPKSTQNSTADQWAKCHMRMKIHAHRM
jgi:hypothetical protein